MRKYRPVFAIGMAIVLLDVLLREALWECGFSDHFISEVRCPI